MGDDGLIGHQVSLDRKLGLLASAQQGLTGVNSAINALAEQYPTLYSYASMQAAFATGVPPNIYAFHRYTRNSAYLSGTLD